MSLDYFSKLLALVLLYKYKVAAIRVSALVRDPFLQTCEGELSYRFANSLMAQHSNDLPVLKSSDFGFGKKLMDENQSADIEVLCINDEAVYPKFLRVIKDAPPLLFLRGDLNVLKSLPGVAIVGARKASKNGLEIARRLGAYTAQNDFVVVSGLALGIDAASHEGCLSSNGKTIAVLASGLDKPNPASNASLGFEILEKGGAWVSEHTVGTPPLKQYFVPRNRIQIGLSAGSIIVEAAVKSGSLSQARFCVGQNRPLFAVVPETSENNLRLNCEGTRHMVEELGAIPLKSRSDYPRLVEMLKREKLLIK